MNICLLHSKPDVVSETFIRAHAERLDTVNSILHRLGSLPAIDGRPVLSQGLLQKSIRKIGRFSRRSPWSEEIQRGYLTAFKRGDTDVVLAEYGPNGVSVMHACEAAEIPLVVHFHGYDASVRSTIDEMRDAYKELFGIATACIVVSRKMERTLEGLGCPSEKLVYFPCGCEINEQPRPQKPGDSKRLVAVGRFVEKKAPHLTVLAFEKIVRQVPDARLTMIGDGPLLPLCRQIAYSLGIDQAVCFLGAQPHARVQAELSNADVFLQHSIVASDGDSEGTPVAVLEAGACGLPVVATSHAGIPDVVIHGKTGLLSEECDIDMMASHACTLLENPSAQVEMGGRGREHITKYFSIDRSIHRLQLVLDAAASGGNVSSVKGAIEQSLPKPVQPCSGVQ
ncbi:glycosyltransferase [Roseiconus lacunae]|uniref:glycosyltransferase n=1 Tax=Roseiconus lacunae TaxID=2605694 RepID=UPI003085B820|nr:glycosyltransferase [Stieleria sp. HD01]